jgi:hypothetical protein
MMPQITYHIRALLLCHDVRLNTSIETRATLGHIPTEEEAIQLLWPVGEEMVARNGCEGCPFELGVYSIEPEELPLADG